MTDRTRSLAAVDEMRLSGLLPVSAALLYVVQAWLQPALGRPTMLAIAGGLVLAGVVLTRLPVTGRLVATAALGLFVADTARPLLATPSSALVAWLVVLWLLLSMWLVPGLPHRRRIANQSMARPARLARVRVSLRLTALVALLVALTRTTDVPDARLVVGASFAMSLVWIVRTWPMPVLSRWRPAAGLIAVWVAASALWEIEAVGELPLVLQSGVAFVCAGLIRDPQPGRGLKGTWLDVVIENPARQLVASFLLVVVIGTVLLGLPVSSAGDGPVRFLDAAFTAVSGVCVTGLIVLDTPTAWSATGQGVLLVLIQLGGLGIMTFATAILGAFGRRLSLRQEGAVAELTSRDNRVQLYGAVRLVLLFTFVCELVGAVVLSAAFAAAGDTWSAAIWRGVFTSISAFCNAGFALQTTSLVDYAHHGLVVGTVSVLIVLGGLSPALVVRALLRREGGLQMRLVLWTTGVLLVVGTALFAASEWNSTLAGMTRLDRLLNAWFQSVTLRTAGFNTVDFADVRPATITISLLWMFVGGSPGGTAGGIKTTTLAVLVLAVLATVRGQSQVRAFGRSIPDAIVYRAASIATLGVFSVVFVLLALQLTQNIPTVPALFETVSALGTVGLSMGATASLDAVGKIVIMVAMFAGRVGSLTMLVFLMAHRPTSEPQLPPEAVDCG